MTQRTLVSLFAVLFLGQIAPVRASAQESDGVREPVAIVSVNFERVKRKLAALPSPNAERSLLELSYYVEVYGRAPGIKMLEGFDTTFGPVNFGPPTHAALLDLWTPEEFSSPAMDLGSLFGWFHKR